MLLNPDIGILSCLDSIFGAILVDSKHRVDEAMRQLILKKVDIAKVARPKFKGTFQYNVFNGIYAVFYEIIVTLNTKSFNKEELDSILENNQDLILDSPYISLDKYSGAENGNVATDEEKFMAFNQDIIDKFDFLSQLIVEQDSFDSACIMYIDWYKKEYYHNVVQNMAQIMQNGFDCKLPGKRKRTYKGLEDSQEYYTESMKVLKSLQEESRIRSTVINEQWFQEEMSNEKKTDDKSMFNIGLREMDATIGELRRGNMLGVLGPPKGGKTRFTNYLVQRALSKGYNVCVWPLEGTKEEWLAMQTAAYLANTSFNALKAGKAEEMLRFDSKDILQKKYINSKQIRELVAAAKQTMATSEQYGRLSFIEGTAYVEDMFDILKTHYETDNPYDVLVIDQLVNVMSKNGKGKTERISEAYMMTKDFLANKLKVPALGIMPAQLKQDVVDYLRSHPEETIDVTAGGESAETIRTPDETIGLFSTKEERDSNMMKIYSVASRHNGSFDDFVSRAYLGCCFFLSQEDDVEANK